MKVDYHIYERMAIQTHNQLYYSECEVQASNNLQHITKLELSNKKKKEKMLCITSLNFVTKGKKNNNSMTQQETKKQQFNGTTRNKKTWRLTKYFLIFVYNELGARRFPKERTVGDIPIISPV